MKNNIIAHRGIYNNENIPENSLLSFKKAIDNDYAIELDVQLTKDNIIVIFHDYNLKRLSKINKKIQKCTYKEINKLYLLNTKEKIPTLKELLKLVNSKVLLDIEIKNTKRIKKTCDTILEEIKNYNNVQLKSFNPRIVKYLKKKTKKIKIGYLISNNYKKRIYTKIFQSKEIIKYCQPDFLVIEKTLLTNKQFKNILNKYKIYVWTIENKSEITDKNFIYICNNLPYN